MQSSLSEMQPTKRKIKIDYRKKEIQEEPINNSDYDLRPNLRPAISRNPKTRSQKDLTGHEIKGDQDDDYQALQEVGRSKTTTNFNNRRNYNNQNQGYKTLDPSEAFS